jgi:hypothetical protein
MLDARLATVTAAQCVFAELRFGSMPSLGVLRVARAVVAPELSESVGVSRAVGVLLTLEVGGARVAMRLAIVAWGRPGLSPNSEHRISEPPVTTDHRLAIFRPEPVFRSPLT